MGLYLALEADGAGAHPAAWRFSGQAPSDVLNPQRIRDTVRAAEAGGFTLVTFADSPLPPSRGADVAGRLDAVGRAAYLSIQTSRIGLAPTIHPAIVEPFHAAAQLASIDHATHGRSAWVVGEANAEELATIGYRPRDVAPSEIADFMEAVRHLWDSWEDDAVIKDVETGRYLDPNKIHHVDFTGAAFTIKGPLITPRPPQGQPVVIANDSLGISAEIVVITGPDLPTITAKARSARNSGAPLVFIAMDVVLDADEPAEKRMAALDLATPWNSARFRHVGRAEELARLLTRLGEVADGVWLHPAVLSRDLPVLLDSVLPATPLHESRGTLRDTLGLPLPANRFAATGMKG
ncbi:LLM class flavin-dependent oxidoreductase [Amycolatopsis sp. NPDC049868]|uniref:LLM class flavin-dependent oxidoreductase n=1 Tax=Amycolatopsis sp. NPDC049868 TaxID=3363934 RepID=UPI00379F1E68